MELAGLRHPNITVLLALAGSLLLGGLAASFVREPELAMRVFLFYGAAVLLIASVMALREGNALGIVAGIYLVARHLIGRSWPHGGDINNYSGVLLSAVLLVIAARSLPAPRDLVRFASFWTGPCTWAIATVSGLLIGTVNLVAGRGVGLAIPLAGLILARRDPHRTFAGLVAAGGIVLSTALYAGGIDPETSLDGRLSGGEFWHTHPNLLAMFCALLAIGWLYLPTYRALRWLVIPVLLGVIIYTDSRTALGAFGAGWLLGFPSRRMRLAVLVLAAAVMLLGASGVLLSARGDDTGGVLSGRTLIWDIALDTWREAPPLYMLLGPSESVDGTVELPDGRVFVAHSAFIGTLLRSGVLGVVCLIAGGVLFLRHTRFLLVDVPPGAAQAGLAAIGVGLTTLYTEDWLTNDIVWWMMALGELLIVQAMSAPPPVPNGDAGEASTGLSHEPAPHPHLLPAAPTSD